MSPESTTRRLSVPLVFVIEDDPTIAQAVAELLNDAGYATRVAPNVAVASLYLSAVLPDCIVLDCGLPDGNGDEVLRELMTKGHAPPTILLSAHPNAKALAAHFGIALVPKPYEAELLVAAVATALEHRIRPRYAQSA
jgi:DNA-binding response OmpR family regulator